MKWLDKRTIVLDKEDYEDYVIVVSFKARKNLIDKIDKIIEELGIYSNRSEFIRYAISKTLAELESNKDKLIELYKKHVLMLE